MPLAVIDHGAAVELQLSRVPLRRDRVAAWYVRGLLVDAGGALTTAELLDWLRGRPVEAVLLGHSHEDHSGGAAALARRGVPVHGGAGTAARLRRPARVPEYRSVLWGQPGPVLVRPPDGLSLEPVGLPGHAPDQFGYFDAASGWLFSGDLVLRRRQQVAMPGEDPYRMMESLRRAIGMQPAALATSHRSLLADPLPVLRDQLGYLEDLAARIAELHAGGAGVAEMVRRVFGGEPETPELGVTWRDHSGGEFSAARWVRGFLRGPGGTS